MHDSVRKEYEELIEAAADQQVRMYSCTQGECSYTLINVQGSVYTQVLLDSAKSDGILVMAMVVDYGLSLRYNKSAKIRIVKVKPLNIAL